MRKCAISSMGFCVADRPMRCSRRPASDASRSSDRARCEPRLVPATAWISSTMTLRVLASIARPESLVSSRYSDSGVVTRICGGDLRIAARSLCGVSPVRTSARISAAAMPWRAQFLGDSAQRRLEIALDVVGQRLERGYVNHLHRIGERAADGFAHQAIDGRKKCRQRLAGTRGRGNQRVAAGLDRGPGGALGRGRFGESCG